MAGAPRRRGGRNHHESSRSSAGVPGWPVRPGGIAASVPGRRSVREVTGYRCALLAETRVKSYRSEIRDNDLGVFVWTVDGMNEWRELLDAGVDGIITNHPGRLQGFLAGRFDPVA